MQNWEVLTTDPDSNEVALRISAHIEWLNKPWGVWSTIESEANKKLQSGAKVVS